MDDPMHQKRIIKARAILNNAHFKRKTADEKERIIRIMLEQGLHVEDLQLLKDEQQNGFNVLDANVMAQILVNLEPREVLSNCTISEKFANFCRNQDVFKFLLSRHYPYAFPTENPHNQYAAITEGVKTTYLMKLENYPSPVMEAVMLGKPSKPEMLPGWAIDNTIFIRVKDLVKHPIFMGWLSKDRDAYLKLKSINSELESFDLRIVNGWSSSLYRKNMHLDFIEENIKRFITDYRKRGMEAIISEPGVQEIWKLSFPVFNIGTSVTESFLENINSIINYSRPEKYRYSVTSLLFIVKGNAIPRGTIAWSIISISNTFNQAEVFRSREEMAAYFVEFHRKRMIRILVASFDRYVDENNLELGEELELPDREQIKSQAFRQWFAEQVPIKGLKSLSAHDIIQYVMTHESFGIPSNLRNTSLFRRVRFV